MKPQASLFGIRRWIGIALLLVAIGLALSWVNQRGGLQSLLYWIEHLGPTAAIAYIITYNLATILFVPGSLLTLGGGALFGVVWGSFYVFVAASLGATFAFLIGRYLSRGWVARQLEGYPRFQAIDAAVARDGFKIVLLTRLSPIFPFNLLNYAYGVTSVSLRDYCLGSIGMLPGTILYVYLGSLIGDLSRLGLGAAPQSGPTQVAQWLLKILGLGATLAVTIYIARLAREVLAQSIAPPPSAASVASVAPSGAAIPVSVAPMDEHNELLVSNLHPADWQNPVPAARYDLVVVGGGPAGLVVAAGAAGLGARVALIEKHLMGGDCLNVGCIPSKCTIASARIAAQLQEAIAYGIEVDGYQVDFSAVMARMRRLRAGLSHHDSVQRFRDLGVDVFLGTGQFTHPQAIAVNGALLHFKKAVIATGARPLPPPIPGLAESGYYTNETIFSLTERPHRLAVIGGGPVGCELAQAFQRLGATVFLLHKHPRLLDRDDPDAAAIVQQQFLKDGIQLLLDCHVLKVERSGDRRTVTCESGGMTHTLEVDAILVGTGRAPNVEELNLAVANVAYDLQRGVMTNDYLQTTNPRIFAAGDVCLPWKFTHTADAAARIVIKNALFSPFGLGKAKFSDLVIPRCTYTDPEIAHVGMDEATARRQGIALTTFTIPMSKVDRAIADGKTEGFAKIHVKRGTDTILGATIVAPDAGNFISEITLAIVYKLGLGKIAGVIHPYPTQAEAIRKAADAYRRTLLTPRTEAFLKWIARL